MLILQFAELFKENKIKVSISEPIQHKPVNYPKIYIISFEKIMDSFAKYSFLSEYIYLYHGKTLIIKEVNEFLKSDFIREDVESIREVDQDGNKYIYLSEKLKEQMNITNDLVNFIRTNFPQ